MDKTGLNKLMDLMTQHTALANAKLSRNLLKIDPNFSKENFSALHNNILIVINRDGDLTMSEISKLLMMPTSTVSRTIQELVLKGFLERYHKENNRKAAYIKLTSKGRALVDAHNDWSENFLLEKINELLDKDGQNEIVRSYSFLVDFLKKF